MNKAIKISLLLGVLIFVLFFLRAGISDVSSAFSGISVKYLILFLAASFVIALILALRWKLILNSFHVRVPLLKCFNYRTAAFAVGYITPSMRFGGEPLRVSLVRKHCGSTAKAASTVVIDRSIDLTSNFLFFLIGLVIVVMKFTLPGNTLFVILAGAGLALIGLSFFYYRLHTGKGFFIHLLRKLRLDRIKWIKKYEKDIIRTEKHVTDFLRKDKKTFFLAMLVSVLAWVFMFLEYKFALLALGYNAPISSLFIVISFVGIAVMMPIPGALGVLEAGQTSAFALIGGRHSTGIALSLVIRARDLMWTAAGIIFIYHHHLIGLFGRSKKEVEKSDRDRRRVQNRSKGP